MARFSDETYTYALAGIAIVVVGFVLHTVGILKPVESYIVRIASPVQGYFYRKGTGISESFALITSIRDIARENQVLEDRVNELEVSLAELQEAKGENSKLREQLQFTKESGFQTTPADVIGVDPNDFLKALIINRGTDDGIEKGKPVLNEKGILLGKILEADKKTASVLLLTDSNSSVVGIGQDSRSIGSVVGELGLSVKLTAIAQEDQAIEGERIVTAGLEDSIPKGLVIGTLKAIEGKDNELFKEAKLEPFANFKNIEMVFVLK